MGKVRAQLKGGLGGGRRAVVLVLGPVKPVSAYLSSRSAVLPMFIAGSVALHGGAFAVISQATRRDGAEPAAPPPMELVVFEVENRAPPPIEEVRAPPSKPVPKAPIKVASVKSSKPRELAPPPTNETPPAETPPKQAPLVVGTTMSSTTTGASLAAPLCTTLY